MASLNGVAGALAGASEPELPAACGPPELAAGAHTASFATGTGGANAICVDALGLAGVAALSMTAAGAGKAFGGSGAARRTGSAATAGS